MEVFVGFADCDGLARVRAPIAERPLADYGALMAGRGGALRTNKSEIKIRKDGEYAVC
jgi:hypothetical protein